MAMIELTDRLYSCNLATNQPIVRVPGTRLSVRVDSVDQLVLAPVRGGEEWEVMATTTTTNRTLRSKTLTREAAVELYDWLLEDLGLANKRETGASA